MTDVPPEFSVLLPVYHRDVPAHLVRAARSVTDEQVLRPAELVVVQDGPVGAPLEQALEQIRRESPVPVRLVVLPENRGLAEALEAGLRACSHDIVARMDADDVSRPERFARQIPFLVRGHDVVGTAIQEFEDDEADPGAVRVPPVGTQEIVRAARLRSPFHHPSVVFRRAAVEAAGGYEHLALLEDYWLFARMLHGGARPANLPEPLLLYRVGAGAYARRGGAEILRSEIELQRRFRRLGFTTSLQAVRNVLVRGGYRLVPEPIRRRSYRRFMLGRTHHGTAA
ncbi:MULTISPECIES: glycosyltransferase [Cellulosimicrobium]|uniref:glycosyltransferase n=1 Tax=Cellulosimicrobium TaxID=157920 RepID=UPI000A32423E|nr:glycosyltransferase [Cellulosimicrobium sp. KWT-B]